MKLTVLATALLLIGAVSVHAQDSTSVRQPDAAGASASGGALATRIDLPKEPFSRSVLLTEFSFLFPLGGRAEANADIGCDMGAELGWLQRIDRRSALGAAVFAVAGSDDPRLGARLRYRRWLSRRFSVDAGLGTILAHDSRYRDKEYVGSLGLSWNDRLHLALQYENYRVKDYYWWYDYSDTGVTTSTHRAWNLYASLKFGREPGIVGICAATVGIIALLSTFDMGPIMTCY